MRKGFIGLLFSCAVALSTAEAQTSINFNSGTQGASIGAFYAGLGVTFTRASWDGFVSTDEGSVGAGGLKFIHTTDSYAPKVGNPVIATFSSLINSISIRGLNVGANGARIDAFDTFGNLLGFSEAFGIDVGATNHPLLTIMAGGISSVRFYQPASVMTEGMLWDNLTFNSASASVVPEPSAYALMATGLVGLVGLARRRRA